MGNSSASLIRQIESLKKSLNALILAHYYQSPEIQDLADTVGDTLELSRKAAASSAELLVVCGVDFVAETVSLMCPQKNVLMPDPGALCPMASMITADRLREKKKQNPGATLICYLKSPAEVKAESDICCTSANAAEIVQNLPKSTQVLFVPDQYLGDYLCTQAGVDITLWPGYCPSHFKIGLEDIQRLKESHPAAKVIVHTECTPQVRVAADAVLGTSDIINFPGQSDAREFIIGTETGVIHQLRKLYPDKLFLTASERAVCGKMRLNTPESVLWSLETLKHEVKIPEEIRFKAKAAIDRMLDLSPQPGINIPFRK